MSKADPKLTDGPFSAHAWAVIAPIREAIDELPLLKELADGSLSSDVFLHYIQQDMLYLKEYSRALAIIAARAPDSEQMLHFLEAAKNAILVEQGLHSDFLKTFGISTEDLNGASASPSTFAYVNFLMSIVQSSSYAVGLAAILPCFWIYWDVGLRIKSMEKTAENPYQAWIDTYGDPEFAEGVRAVIAFIDQAAETASADEYHQMLEAFTRASQYEWMFWQSATEREAWRV